MKFYTFLKLLFETVEWNVADLNVLSKQLTIKIQFRLNWQMKQDLTQICTTQIFFFKVPAKNASNRSEPLVYRFEGFWAVENWVTAMKCGENSAHRNSIMAWRRDEYRENTWCKLWCDPWPRVAFTSLLPGGAIPYYPGSLSCSYCKLPRLRSGVPLKTVVVQVFFSFLSWSCHPLEIVKEWNTTSLMIWSFHWTNTGPPSGCQTSSLGKSSFRERKETIIHSMWRKTEPSKSKQRCQ